MRRPVTGVLLCMLLAVNAFAGLEPLNLKCEYQKNPIGIDTPQPRLSWILESIDKGQQQTAYRILVASDSEKLSRNNGDLWDTGRVNSSNQLNVEYEGIPLSSNQHCYWKVMVWDRKGHASAWSTQGSWMMGLLEEDAWKGTFISAADNSVGNAGILFRKDVSLVKRIKRATVYICGLGQFELFVNGQKVGDHVLDPGWTNYRKTCMYVTFDVTDFLDSGDNTLGVSLGNGFYNVVGGRYTKFKGSFDAPAFILQMNLEFNDGSETVVASDDTWSVSSGPITFSCIYGGEDYDARLEKDGWDKAGFDDSRWQRAAVVHGPGGKLISHLSPPVRIMNSFKPIKITEPQPGVYVYDLGQNFSGWPHITVKGNAGTTITLTPGELLDNKGFVTQRGSGGPVLFKYTLKGDGIESWHPHFTYYGFRYVQVEGGTPDSLKVQDHVAYVKNLEGHFIHSSSETVGSFSCSNTLFNDIHHIITAAMRSNMQSVFTDCPHREKLGWLEETHLLGPSLMYNYDLARLYTKIMRDMQDSQLSNGLVPDIAPEYVVFRDGFRDSPEWGSAYVINPWNVYQYYGDIRILEEHYKGMQKYVDYLLQKSENGIVYHGLGDWYDIGPGSPGRSKLTPPGLTSTAILYQDIEIMKNVARLLQKNKDSAYYKSVSEKIRTSFNEKFFNKNKNYYARNSQTANAMPLAIGLVDNELSDKVLVELIKDIQEHHNHITAGDIGHLYVLRALAENGRSDIVYDMTSRTDVPSYGYQVKKGATSLTEAWDADRKSSHNHFMLGHVEEWFYKYVAGIQPGPDAAGFDRIIIHPHVIGDLSWAKGSYQSIRGDIKSEWKLNDGFFTLNVQIPPNTVARIFFPTRSIDDILENGQQMKQSEFIRYEGVEDQSVVLTIGSGKYTFSAPYQQRKYSEPFSKKFVTIQDVFPQDTLVFSLDQISARMTVDTKDADIRYTLNGQEPDKKSFLYKEPFTVNKDATIKAKAFKKGWNPSFSSLPVTYRVVDPSVNGLSYSYYEGEWDRLPMFDELIPVKEGRTFFISYTDIKPREDHYAIRFKGYLAIKVDGNYTFHLSSDDGSRLVFDNRVLIDNDGTHSIREKKGTVYLKRGLYPIQIEYMEDIAGEFLQLMYEGPGIIKQLVPSSFLFLHNNN